jgi:hypothetical protein
MIWGNYGSSGFRAKPKGAQLGGAPRFRPLLCGLILCEPRLTDRPSLACCQLRTSCPQPLWGIMWFPDGPPRGASSDDRHLPWIMEKYA